MATTASNRLKVLGVCGGICSGKSLACKILRDLPGAVAHIDADSLAHSVYLPGSKAIEDIREYFGTKVIDSSTGTVDRKELGSIVFSDKSQMAALEKIVWPYVQRKLQEELNTLESNLKDETQSIAIVEAAVMLDAGWQDMFDGVWIVHSPEEIALNRLEKNRGLSSGDALTRIKAQSSRRGIGNIDEEVKNRVVTAVIENNGTVDDLTQALKNAWIDSKCWKW